MLQIFIKDIFPQNNNFPYFHFYNEKLYSFVGYFLFSYFFWTKIGVLQNR